MRILSTGAYRLFFPAAGLFAALTIPLWLWIWSGGWPAWPLDGLRWHQHEMLFGYLGLALGGFLLTAVPNWTSRPALAGCPLVALFLLWVVGRVGFAVLPDGAGQIVCVMLYPVILAVVVCRELWVAGNRRNLPIAGMVWLFVVADALFLAGFQDFALRLGFALSVVMTTLVGGRVTPAFARNWLKARGSGVGIPEFGVIDKLAMAAVGLAAIVWVGWPDHSLGIITAAIAAVLLLLRLLRWKFWAVASEPLLLALHAGYAWIVISLALLAAQNAGLVEPVQVLHAMGAGAVGGMTLIVMMRAILGHANRPIQGTAMDRVLLVCVHLGAALRVLAPATEAQALLIELSGVLWALGFALFFLRYGRIALLPRL
ncbi:NnrS family protein [Rhodobacteraceae bacterium F11138]|nr:NnrS family protein [Rhodobacteraceae bacterium F11138]